MLERLTLGCTTSDTIRPHHRGEARAGGERSLLGGRMNVAVRAIVLASFIVS
jgi:hypothetical protein